MHPARSAARKPSAPHGVRAGFTLIELILVMALLVAVAGMLAPSLGGFFRGRALDAEARRFITLARYARGAAAADGVPMLLWIDPANRTYGVVEEFSLTGAEPRRLTYELAPRLLLEVDLAASAGGVAAANPANPAGIVLPLSGTLANAARAGMPMIRFQPDGFLDPSSPTALWLREEDGVGSASDDPAAGVVWITQTLNRTGYEIQTNQFAWVRR